jgi:hypothetical protein
MGREKGLTYPALLWLSSPAPPRGEFRLITEEQAFNHKDFPEFPVPSDPILRKWAGIL